ncbi:MAG: secretin N-terminal domain-containing protein [Candidatus Sericytochromatia bacterium]|nr:secretin N-terminal domain-containing protein [Candidatus Sericytochromatia bacterium]
MLTRFPLALAVALTALCAAGTPAVPARAAEQPEVVALEPQAIRVPGGRQRVTLRLRQTPLAEALRLIATRHRLSFSIGSDVAGTVNTDFYNERLDRILEVLVSTNNVHVRRFGTTYMFSGSPRAGLGGVRVFQLNYASASELVKILQDALTASGLGGLGGAVAAQAPAAPAAPGAPVATAVAGGMRGPLLTADPRSNAIIVSGNAYLQEQVARLVARLDRPHSHRLFRLNYIKAEEAASLLTGSLFAGAQNTGVKFIPLTRENALMVVASGEDIRLVEEVIRKVDRRLRQVMIEVRLVELAGTSNSLLGVTFDAQSGTLTGGWQPATGLDLAYAPLQEALSQLRVKINALLRDNKARLLASPSLVAMDSKESRIEITDDIIEKVLIETTVNANNIFTRQNVTLGTAGVTLAITPKINPDGFISMKVDPTISFIRETVRGATNAEILATLKSSRKLSTPEVRVRDGETLVIGGLNQERTTETADKVPLLGDLPYLGSVFRRTDITKTTTELLVMITPRVVVEKDPPAKPPAAATPAKPTT